MNAYARQLSAAQRPDCHYCGGTGNLEERIDVDDYRDVPCDYCDGTGEARHSANTCTRWIGPGYWVGGHYEIGDPLVLLSRWRAARLKRRSGWDGPYTAKVYGEMRQIAVSPVCLPREWQAGEEGRDESRRAAA